MSHVDFTDRVWVSQDGGSILTPDAADSLIAAGEVKLVGRTASTLVIRDEGREVTFHRMPGADYV